MNELIQRKKILALILAGGVGGRLGLLTENRAKPVMPFAGNYRLIDFALSIVTRDFGAMSEQSKAIFRLRCLYWKTNQH